MPLGANKAAIMGVAGVSTGDVVLLSSQTADDDASISFTSGITSTYGEYIFRFYNIHVETNDADLVFQANATDTADYNDIAMITTCIQSYQNESDNDPSLNYNASDDQAQGTAFQIVIYGLGDQNDENGAGELHLFNPSSTTYVKHFISKTSSLRGVADANPHLLHAGYFNTTTAIDDVQFKTDTGNFSGTIKMWGVK